MSLFQTINIDHDDRNIVTISLNRPDKQNAFNAQMIKELNQALDQLIINNAVRALVLRGNGEHFSSGADLIWMQETATQPILDNQNDALQLAHLLYQLDNLPYPTIAKVQGHVFGGALGLICCCDIVIADNNCVFCLSEAKIGLIPATISPYVCRSIGVKQVRHLALTAEPFDSGVALKLGLIHKVSNQESALDATLDRIHLCAPQALADIKALGRYCETHKIDHQMVLKTSQWIAERRTTPEAREGIKAFFEKRQANWCRLPEKKES